MWEYDIAAHRITMIENANTIKTSGTSDLPGILKSRPCFSRIEADDQGTVPLKSCRVT